MLKVTGVFLLAWGVNEKKDFEAINAILKKVPGINFPGLYDNFFIEIQVKQTTTVDWINRRNFELNTLFKNDVYINSCNESDCIKISLAEAIALIYELTVLPIQRQRLPKTLTSVDAVIDLLKFYLLDNHPQSISKFKDMILPDFCPAWSAYIQEESFINRFDKLMKTHKDSDIFTDVLYSSIPIDTWFKCDDTIIHELISSVDHIEDYRCIETIYFKSDFSDVVNQLLDLTNYEITMCGKYNDFNTVTFNVSSKPDGHDIILIKDSYKEFYKN